MKSRVLIVLAFASLSPILLSAEFVESPNSVHYALSGDACADIDSVKVVTWTSCSKEKQDSIENLIQINNNAVRNLQEELKANVKNDSTGTR